MAIELHREAVLAATAAVGRIAATSRMVVLPVAGGCIRFGAGWIMPLVLPKTMRRMADDLANR